MGIVSEIKSCLYQFLVRSHVLYYLFPVLVPILRPFLKPGRKRANYLVRDAKGKTLLACKVDGRILPPFGVEQLRMCSEVTIRESDVILCGYPKTGCHWTHEIIYMLVTRRAQLSKYGKPLDGMIDSLPQCFLDSIPSPRVLNTHFLFKHLPRQVHQKKNKLILTTRNPKDTVVSYYNHFKNLKDYYDNYDGDFDDFFDLFMSGSLAYGSYFDFSLSWDHHLNKPTTNPILLVKFEDTKSKPDACVRRIARFLDIDVTDQFVSDIVQATSFNKMKTYSESRLSKGMFRKGKVGDWRNWLTDEQSAAIDKVWQQRMTGCTYQPEY